MNFFIDSSIKWLHKWSQNVQSGESRTEMATDISCSIIILCKYDIKYYIYFLLSS